MKHHHVPTEVIIRFGDVAGNISAEIHLDKIFRNDFKLGETNKFTFDDICEDSNTEFGEIAHLEIWRKRGVLDDGLFLEFLEVEQTKSKATFMFPVHRWIPMGWKNKLCLRVHDSCLPQDDHFIEQRVKELKKKRQTYRFGLKIPVVLPVCAQLPREAAFAKEYELDIGKKAVELFLTSKWNLVTAKEPTTLHDFKALYTSSTFPLPDSAREDWYLEDEYFGEQRVAGCNPLQIQLCTSIPNNFPVTDQMVAPSIEGKTLEGTIKEKRLFLLDYVVLDGIENTDPERESIAPLVLLYRDSKDRLMPIAIQLQQKPCEENPVFLPSDPPYTWLMAKAWCNLADGSVHQSKCHLGFTHVFCESMCVATHRELSPSHPIFKLLAPHYLYLLAINDKAMTALVAPGGALDNSLYVGRLGVFEIINRCAANWRIDVDGNPLKDIERRMVGKDVLPHYPYRDDALAIHAVINEYVSEIVQEIYKGDKIKEDYEIQGWYKCISRPVEKDGVGLQGVPGNGDTATIEDIVALVTTIVFNASVQHAAVNFLQYDQYGFPIVYPASLNGKPMKSKEPLTEEDVLEVLPDISDTINMMVTAQLLSQRGTNKLGDFEMQYGHDEIALSALKKFRHNLSELKKEFALRHQEYKYPYTTLDPDFVPNAISI